MSKKILGVPIAFIVAIVVIYVAVSDFQSTVEIQQEGKKVIESAKESDTDEFTDNFGDWFVGIVFPILLVSAFISVILGIIFGKKR